MQRSPADEDVVIQKIDGIAVTVKEGLAVVQEGSSRIKGEMKTEMKAGFDEMRGGIERMNDEIKEGFNETKGGLEDLKGVVDKTAASIQESLLRLKNLQVPNYPYPHLVVVREAEPGGTLFRPQGTKHLLRRPRFSRVRAGIVKEMTLHFLCPVDLSEVPCGVGGQGFRLRVTRDWVKRISPVLQVGHTSCSAFFGLKEAMQCNFVLRVETLPGMPFQLPQGDKVTFKIPTSKCVVGAVL